MTTRTRTKTKMDVNLESLEARESPTVGIAGAWQAALAQSQAHSLRGAGFQSVQRALPLARPGSTFRGPAFHPGVTVNASGGANRAPFNPMLARAQARNAAMHTATPTLRAGMFNRGQLQPSQAVPRSMRAPTSFSPPSAPSTPMTPPNSPDINPAADAETPTQPLPPNVSGTLNALYQEFSKSGTIPVSDGPGSIVIDGSNVGVSVHGNGQGSFSDFVSTLQNLGMEINASSDVTWTITGMLPIDQLPTAAQTPQTLSITPMYKPITAR